MSDPPPGPANPHPAPDGGDPACWLDRVCDACGRLVETGDACPVCGALIAPA